MEPEDYTSSEEKDTPATNPFYFHSRYLNDDENENPLPVKYNFKRYGAPYCKTVDQNNNNNNNNQRYHPYLHQQTSHLDLHNHKCFYRHPEEEHTSIKYNKFSVSDNGTLISTVMKPSIRMRLDLNEPVSECREFRMHIDWESVESVTNYQHSIDRFFQHIVKGNQHRFGASGIYDTISNINQLVRFEVYCFQMNDTMSDALDPTTIWGHIFTFCPGQLIHLRDEMYDQEDISSECFVDKTKCRMTYANFSETVC